MLAQQRKAMAKPRHAGRSRFVWVPPLLLLFCFCSMTTVFTSPIGRRSVLLPALGIFCPLPARAQQGPAERMSLYKGKAVSVRESAEWYRFYVGDLVSRGSGEDTRDGLKVSDEDCGGGLCLAGQALSELQRVVTSGSGPGGGLSQVERALTTPLFLMVGFEVWDPDSSSGDEARKAAGKFQATINELRAKLSERKDADVASKLYRKSLGELNDFFRIANEAGGVKPQDVEYLPQLPLTKQELDSSEYWKAERVAFDEANDPVRIFQERNAFGSRDLRQSLKRFPGATLLLR